MREAGQGQAEVRSPSCPTDILLRGWRAAPSLPPAWGPSGVSSQRGTRDPPTSALKVSLLTRPSGLPPKDAALPETALPPCQMHLLPSY